MSGPANTSFPTIRYYEEFEKIPPKCRSCLWRKGIVCISPVCKFPDIQVAEDTILQEIVESAERN